jgi:hypothetical protein
MITEISTNVRVNCTMQQKTIGRIDYPRQRLPFLNAFRIVSEAGG